MADITVDDVVINHNRYSDLPLTLFPSSVDYSEGNNNHYYMSDVGADTKSLIDEFNTYYNNGNLSGCQTLLDNGLKTFSFDAAKFNLLSDAIIALQRFSYITQQDAETMLYFLNLAIATKYGMNFNLDYRVSLNFIKTLEQILAQ